MLIHSPEYFDLSLQSCTFDKVMLFDVPSRTYIGLDAGPFDAGSFDVASEYVSFLGEMSSLYS